MLGASGASAGPGFPGFRFAQTFGLTRPFNPLRIFAAGCRSNKTRSSAWYPDSYENVVLLPGGRRYRIAKRKG
jgi:hypothetical protein